jgi:23S rRNA pseudouridine1911/1915/1917 synthase
VLPEKMDLDIVYEDPYLMVINKPRGVVVHTGAGAKSGTLLNGLLGRAAANNLGRANNLEATAANLERAGIVHRLDKNTAGLLVVAKTAEAQSALGAMFEKHEIKRTYLGLVEGVVKGDMTIDKNIVRHKTARTLFTTTTAGGRRAITRLKVLEQYKKYTLCEFTLETGRTHQIRVHCKSINHAIVGDPEYNPNGTMKSLNGQMLSAVKLEFCHPITKKDINIEISASKQLTDAIKKCKNVV